MNRSDLLHEKSHIDAIHMLFEQDAKQSNIYIGLDKDIDFVFEADENKPSLLQRMSNFTKKHMRDKNSYLGTLMREFKKGYQQAIKDINMKDMEKNIAEKRKFTERINQLADGLAEDLKEHGFGDNFIKASQAALKKIPALNLTKEQADQSIEALTSGQINLLDPALKQAYDKALAKLEANDIQNTNNTSDTNIDDNNNQNNNKKQTISSEELRKKLFRQAQETPALKKPIQREGFDRLNTLLFQKAKEGTLSQQSINRIAKFINELEQQ